MKPKEILPYRVVWRDSRQRDGWVGHSEIDHLASNLHIHSVGYLIDDRKNVIVLASCVNTDGWSRAPIAIPKGAIKEMVLLKDD
jgi:hypothetical protein